MIFLNSLVLRRRSISSSEFCMSENKTHAGEADLKVKEIEAELIKTKEECAQLGKRALNAEKDAAENKKALDELNADSYREINRYEGLYQNCQNILEATLSKKNDI